MAAGWGPKAQLRAVIQRPAELRMLVVDPGQRPQFLETTLPPSDNARLTPDGERLVLSAPMRSWSLVGRWEKRWAA